MKSIIILVFGIIIITVSTQLINVKLAIKNKNKKKQINNYIKKSIMTEYERYFYNIFIELEDELDIKVHPQVNLATVVKKTNNNHYINELFKNIDFGIFNADYSDLLVLIEIDDSSHNTKKRILRDKKVTEILSNAGIDLIKFYSKYPNKKDYIKNRLRDEILKIRNNQ